MNKLRICLFSSILLLSLITTAKSTLLDRGNGLIYDDILNITWLQDANYAGGTMTWDDAMTWSNNLVYQGYDDWRLPTLSCSGGSCTNGEMAHLYYTEGISSSSMGIFSDVKPYMYWTNTEYDLDISMAWRFNFKSGTEGKSSKSLKRYGWAVRDGDTSPAVMVMAPEPGTWALFATGIIVLIISGKKIKRP